MRCSTRQQLGAMVLALLPVPTLGGYEVFYQTAAGSNGSSTTTTTELTLTGLEESTNIPVLTATAEMSTLSERFTYVHNITVAMTGNWTL